MSHAIFVWNVRYETSCDAVERQHRHLVTLLNRLGELYAANGTGFNRCSLTWHWGWWEQQQKRLV